MTRRKDIINIRLKYLKILRGYGSKVTKIRRVGEFEALIKTWVVINKQKNLKWTYTTIIIIKEESIRAII